MNPPPFIWVPAKRDSVYVLQLATSNAFPLDSTQTFDNLRRSVFVPRQPLQPGQWFWRYGVRNREQTVFGRADHSRFPTMPARFRFRSGRTLSDEYPRIAQDFLFG